MKLEGAQRDEHIGKMTQELKEVTDSMMDLQKEIAHLEEEKRRAEDSLARSRANVTALKSSLDDSTAELVLHLTLHYSYNGFPHHITRSIHAFL